MLYPPFDSQPFCGEAGTKAEATGLVVNRGAIFLRIARLNGTDVF